MNQKQKHNMSGFTLVELMIVVAIIGIIATIAVPSYQAQMRETRRSDAHNALLRLAGLQERYYLQNNSYAPDIGTLNPPNVVSEEGFYNLSAAGDASTFTVTATAAPGEAQVDDVGCTVINLTQAGQKTPANCW